MSMLDDINTALSVAKPETVEVDSLKSTINVLENKLKWSNDRLELYGQDANLISEALKGEAEHRGWCDDYNDFVDNLNCKLHLIQLEPLSQDYEVTVRLTKTITTDVVVTVRASSDEAAQDLVETDYSFNDLQELARESSLEYWDVDDDDIEVRHVRAG